jgi:spore germination protein KA/spore germination protein
VATKIAFITDELKKIAAPSGQPFVFTTRLTTNRALLASLFHDCDDVVFRSFSAGGHEWLLMYVNGMVNTALLERGVLSPLLQATAITLTAEARIKEALAGILSATALESATMPSQCAGALLQGKALLMADGKSDALLINVIKFAKRNIEESKIEGSVLGPRDGFNETLSDNIVLLRRRSKDANLKVRILNLGARTQTSIALVYVANLVKPGLVQEVERRLSQVRAEEIIYSGTIAEYIVDHPWSPFPQVHATERPDAIVSGIYEGRVGILVDNTPQALLVPCTYPTLLQASDDYVAQPVIASLIRFTRYLSAVIGVYLLPFYIAMISFHPGLLPVSLSISIAELRSKTPFPTILEVLFMEAILEIFQEATVRLPTRLSGAASTLGAFVIGTTVVEAGLVNPLLVVITAMTAIASYTMPSYSLSLTLRWLRLPAIFAAAFLGLYGLLIAWLVMTVHVCSLRSFGESYLGTLFDITLMADWKDTMVRLPARLLKTRPKAYGAQERNKTGDENG